jgi:hypothetical protein
MCLNQRPDHEFEFHSAKLQPQSNREIHTNKRRSRTGSFEMKHIWRSLVGVGGPVPELLIVSNVLSCSLLHHSFFNFSERETIFFDQSMVFLRTNVERGRYSWLVEFIRG